MFPQKSEQQIYSLKDFFNDISMILLANWILSISIIQREGSVEIPDFEQFQLWKYDY